MVERRKPLVLSSTKALINLVLSSSRTTDGIDRTDQSSAHFNSPTTLLPAGILRLQKEILDSKVASLDDSVLVGLPTSVLKKLSITSGSLIFVKNVEMNIRRMGQAFVLDPPSTQEHSCDYKLIFAQSPQATLVFPSYSYSQTHLAPLDRDIAYVSPILAFNLKLHVSCFKSLVHQGKETLASLFEEKVDNETNGKGNEATVISLRLEPCSELPRYASHLRISFVKIPECGTLQSIKGISSIEAKDRQEMIDLALHNYFGKDRYLSRGDLFYVYIDWNCKSAMCIPCSQKMQNANDSLIYFKVVALEPSDEPVLRVSRTQTALVLGGSVPSAVPPDLLISRSKGFVPLQRDIAKNLASILTPPLCPSALSSKFRVAVLLNGLPGCGKRTVVKYVANLLGLHVVEYSCHNLMSSSERKTSVALTEAFKTARRYSPAILLLRHFDVFRNLGSQMGSSADQAAINSEVASVIREFTEPDMEDEDIYSEENFNGDSQANVVEMVSMHPLLLIASADSSEGLPPSIRRCFTHEISMGPLTEEQRAEMLSQSLHHVPGLIPNVASDDFMKDLVGQTSGFIPRDIHALIADAGASLIPRPNIQFDNIESERLGENRSSVLKPERDNETYNDASRVLGKEDLAKALERSKKRNASALGTPKVPNIKWEDVGGLEDVKKSILDTVQSSGSGSESGTQTLKSVKSKSSEKSNNSGSSDGDANGSIGLNDGDGSDSGSGTQSSWTKQAAEADSPQTVSPWDRIAVCPDSTCAQFISPNAEASGNKNMPVTATRESKEPGEDLDNVSRGKELVIGRPRDQDLQPEIPIEVPVKLIGRKQKILSEIDTNTFTTHIDQGNLNPNGESPSTKYEVDITNTSYPQTDSRELEAPKGFSKALEIKDEAIIDSEEIAAHELSVERLSKVTDLGKTIQDDYDVLRHLELSTFSRCNTALSAFEAPNENTGSGSPLDHSFDDVKKELVCSHQPLCQCSNGIINNNNIDMGSDTDRNFANPVVFTEKSRAISTANCFDLSSSLKPMKTDLICTRQKAMLVKADERAATEVLAPPRGSYQEIPMQHLQHYNHFGKEKQQPPSSMDDLSFNKLAAEAPQSGSSNVFSGHVEGKNGNYSLNKSASGSNHGRIHGINGPNGSSTAANAGGIDIENFNAVAGKSGSCDASGRGSGKHRNQNQLAQNEAALTKFHQKRKERCFPKKVQHQSRKRQVEQRPHVQEQFVQQPDPENSSSAADS